MHQDHGQSPEICQGAIDLGFSSVMMDGSLEADGKTIASYEYNVEVTRKVVEMAHKVGVTVEGELGCLGSLETMQGDKEDGHGTDAVMTREQLLTDPEQAADFVKRTQLDALAIAIGTSHGAYKFTRKPTGDILAIDRVEAIHRRIPNTHLVTGAVRKFLAENPEKFDAREWLKPAREAAMQICKQRYIEFGCEGQGSKIKGHSLQVVAQKYASGELSQVVQ